MQNRASRCPSRKQDSGFPAIGEGNGLAASENPLLCSGASAPLKPRLRPGLLPATAIHPTQAAAAIPRARQRGDRTVPFQQGPQESTQVHLNQPEAVKGSLPRGPGLATQTGPEEGRPAGVGTGGWRQLKREPVGLSPRFLSYSRIVSTGGRFQKRAAAFATQGFGAAVPRPG